MIIDKLISADRYSDFDDESEMIVNILFCYLCCRGLASSAEEDLEPTTHI